jgi:Polyphosphate kinase
MTILDTYSFRITRDTDMEIQEDEADDLLEQIEENIRQRMFGNVVRLEVEHEMPQYMLDILVTNLELKPSDVYPITPPLGLSDVMSLYSLPFGNLKEKPYIPRLPKIFEEEKNIFQIIKQRDVLLHHPYDAFKPVVEFIKQASRDPDVLQSSKRFTASAETHPWLTHLLKRRKTESKSLFWWNLKPVSMKKTISIGQNN